GGAGSVAGSFAFTSPTTAPNAGTNSHTVAFVPANSGNYNGLSTTVNVVVSKATPTITAAPTASGITYGQTLADSVLSGGAASTAGSFAFTSPATAPNAGTANQGITFTPADTANYNSATGLVSLTVVQASQTITFGALSPVNIGVAPFVLSASGGGSGNAVTFVSSNPGVATVSGSMVTVVGVGATTITASQAGNGNYLAATDVSRTLTVNSVRQSVAGTTVTLDFSEGAVGNALSYANNWSTSDTAARPDGYAQDGTNLAGFLGGYNTGPSGANTQLSYGFDPGSSDRYVFAWTQNISSSSADYPGSDIFGWKFLSGGTEAFSVKFLNDTTTARDLKVQGYSGAGTALAISDGQINNLFIDRDEAWKFRATADLAGDKWSLDVWRNDLNNWYGLVIDAALSSGLTSLDGMAATWTVADTNGVAGDNIMSFDNISLQGKQTVAISLNVPTNAVYSGSAQAVTPTTTPSGV
ncbi:MAG: hypothetical protein EB079_07090, partial [Verrucomicrobia bacterium]|nr:hypothetical protein [Verrucomicrobiota bacterium]